LTRADVPDERCDEKTAHDLGVLVHEKKEKTDVRRNECGHMRNQRESARYALAMRPLCRPRHPPRGRKQRME
jgi:hypothetical protein